MTEKELGKALLARAMIPASPGPDPRQLTQRILDRDRRRIRLLAGLATLFWVLTTAGVVCFCPFYVMVVAPRLRAYQAGRAQLEKDWNDWAMVGDWAAYWILACVISLLFAAVCTVLLILLSRRATLRQINAGLLEISEQLKQLAQRSASQTPEGPVRTVSLPPPK
jgi:heme exporter protein D